MTKLEQTYQELLIELNNIRDNQLTIKNFTRVEDWLNYSIEIAKKKAYIFSQIEKLTKNR